jgi:trehalose 6-phosphate synthase/phosphatase
MGRLLIVANRLPVTVTTGADGRAHIETSPGGLVSGLSGLHERGDGLWIGWLGDPHAAEDPGIARELAAQRLVAVPLSDADVQQYYHGFSNAVIWPLFHYLIERLPLEIENFETYERVNERFAAAIVEHYRPGDLVWVHDFQLLLVPELVRHRLPDARIGFFLHIPFPSSEVFRTLPHRERLLEGMLGADIVGFHTASYLRHFATSVLRVLGATSEVDRIPWQGRDVHMAVFPLGVDATTLARDAARPEIGDLAETFRSPGGERMLLGIDRLDYTKGIPRRLLAFERLLQRHPELRERVRLVQVAVPSREDVQAYQSFREQAEGLIGRIAGEFATPSWMPVHWMYRGVSHDELLALYRAAEVMLVTPLRDGMNLVAKEFCAARVDEDGVLVLSEFAGAASELSEALMVNPFDVEASAAAYYRALVMPEDERRARMQALRHRVLAYDADRWAERYLAALAATADRPQTQRKPTAGAVMDEIVARLEAADAVCLLLDYDGTLVPFAPSPELARPDGELSELLQALATRPHWQVHVVSGRPRGVLERWFGALPVGLHAEHGMWSRAPGAAEWTGGPPADMEWRPAVEAILADFAVRTPGSLVEKKSASLAWHYRACDPEFGQQQALELHAHLTERLSNLPVQILPGDKVIEVRPHGMTKGSVVTAVRESAPPGSVICALGDDRTDDDMFRALGEHDVGIQVGNRGSRAAYVVSDVSAARRFLQRLVAR